MNWSNNGGALLSFVLVAVVVAVILVMRRSRRAQGASGNQRSTKDRCEIPGCKRFSETDCDICAKDICNTHGGWVGVGGEVEFWCHPCTERNQSSGNPPKIVRFSSRAEADRWNG